VFSSPFTHPDLSFDKWHPGFLAGHIASSLLQLGFRVRGIVRSQDKALDFQNAFDKEFGVGKYERHVVENYNAEGVFDDVLKGALRSALVEDVLLWCLS
jgi:uncharacterized protein YbjT (DUF2867 family)